MCFLKRTSILLVAAALLVGVNPRTGLCQAVREACAMTCCKGEAPAPVPVMPESCPLIQVDVTHDAIGISSIRLAPVLTQIAYQSTDEHRIHENRQVFTRFSIAQSSNDAVPWRTPQSIPAPPSLA